MISLEQGWKCMFKRVPVYWVHTFLHEYVVDEVLIYQIFQPVINCEPNFSVKSSFTGEYESVNGYELFLDKTEAIEECKRSQYMFGHVIITQKEYDELIALKQRYKQEGVRNGT